MSIVTWIFRILFALPYLVFGANFFLKFLPMPELESESAKQFIGLLVATKYLLVVKILEIAGGLLVLSGRFSPLGLIVLGPITINILLWDLLLTQQPALGVALTVLLLINITLHYKSFAPIFGIQK